MVRKWWTLNLPLPFGLFAVGGVVAVVVIVASGAYEDWSFLLFYASVNNACEKLLRGSFLCCAFSSFAFISGVMVSGGLFEWNLREMIRVEDFMRTMSVLF